MRDRVETTTWSRIYGGSADAQIISTTSRVQESTSTTSSPYTKLLSIFWVTLARKQMHHPPIFNF